MQKTVYGSWLLTICLLSWPCHRLVAQEVKSDLSPFLRPTEFIDSDHPKIVAKAVDLTRGCKTDAEKVKALYEFVRDSYNEALFESYKASKVLALGGNSCHRRSNLLAALCRAVDVPARLHLQLVTIKNFRFESGDVDDLLFTHGITGIRLDAEWYLYDPVGNDAKWRVWVQDAYDGLDRTIPFHPDRDCLFEETEKIKIKTLPVYFTDHTDFLLAFRECVRTRGIGFTR